MADPFAPPSDAPRRRSPATARPVPAYEPEPGPSAWAEPQAPRDAAHPGLFWVVAAIGIGLLCLGRLLAFFTYVGDLDGEDVAPAVFGVFGILALATGLALAAVLQRGLSTPVRAALMLGAGFFALSGDAYRFLAALSGNPFF